MKYAKHITELIGNTPLVKINNITKDITATVLVKLESYNPGILECEISDSFLFSISMSVRIVANCR